MASTKLSQSRVLSGSKAFTGVRPRTVSVASNGIKYTMGRKDSFMVEVNVGEDEPEDIAVKKFMKKVVDCRLIEQLRARRYKETPLEEFKRRTRERIEARKMKIVLPTYEEESGALTDLPFDEFFQPDPDSENPFLAGGYAGAYAGEAFYGQQDGGSSWGGYVDANRNGGYLTQPFVPAYNQAPQGGGYMAGPPAGYAGSQQQGGYVQ